MPSAPSTSATGRTSAGRSPPGGTLAIDNAISHAAELSDVNRLLADDPRLTTVHVPIGDGLLVSVDGDG